MNQEKNGFGGMLIWLQSRNVLIYLAKSIELNLVHLIWT